jgi:hypothetical protein
MKRILLPSRSTNDALLFFGVCSLSLSTRIAPRVGSIRGNMKQIWKFETLISPVTDSGRGPAAAARRDVLDSPGEARAGLGGGIPRKV